MAEDSIRIFPLGDSALTIEFGSVISERLNTKVLGLADYFDSNRFPGFIEAVPAYSSLTIFYDLILVRRGFPQYPTAFDAVKSQLIDHECLAAETPIADKDIISIPVDFSGENAPDLQFVADGAHLKKACVIELFTSKTYRVYMLGFLPGFAYMGEIDGRIAIPRRDAPRLRIPKGSVGIAGRQTGIYPFESPGGWQIIGKTDSEMFTPDAETPSFLNTGDRIKFIDTSG